MFHRFLSDDAGATAIEYSLIASLIAITVIASMQAVAEASNENFFKIAEAVAGATGGAAPPTP